MLNLAKAVITTGPVQVLGLRKKSIKIKGGFKIKMKWVLFL